MFEVTQLLKAEGVAVAKLDRLNCRHRCMADYKTLPFPWGWLETK